MTAPPLISVIIPSYNSARYVVEAVESALAQTYRPLEVILIDDGSTDDTRARLAPYFDRIRYFAQDNAGLSAARNRGIREARGQWLAFLDADDKWLPTKLSRQWAYIEAHPDVPLVHCDLEILHEPEGTRSYTDRGLQRFSGECYAQLLRGNRLIPSAVLVSRNCLSTIDVFDEAIRGASTQDYDLWLRIARRFPFGYVPEPLAVYRQHANNASRQQRMMVEDEYYVIDKALRADRQCGKMLPELSRRAARLAFDAGYMNVEAGDLPRARRYLRSALRHAPLDVRYWLYYLSTYLPTSLRAPLRRIKRRLASARRAAQSPLAT